MSLLRLGYRRLCTWKRKEATGAPGFLTHREHVTEQTGNLQPPQKTPLSFLDPRSCPLPKAPPLQVEHVLMEGAKAAGAVLSAVVDSIRPKPETA